MTCQPYLPTNYGAPPYGWTPLATYPYPMPGYLWPAGYAYTPPPPSPMVSPSRPTTADRDDDSTIVDKGAMVVDRDDEEVGVVDDVYFERDSGQLSGVVVRLGGFLRTMFGGGETVEIRGRMIERVDGGVVHLRTSRNELKRVS